MCQSGHAGTSLELYAVCIRGASTWTCRSAYPCGSGHSVPHAYTILLPVHVQPLSHMLSAKSKKRCYLDLPLSLSLRPLTLIPPCVHRLPEGHAEVLHPRQQLLRRQLCVPVRPLLGLLRRLAERQKSTSSPF